MNFDHGLNPGDNITNRQLLEIFKCSSQGGMRRSHKTNTLAIVSDHTNPLYEDWWEGDIFHYAGMGTEGDQSLIFAQNKTLAESNLSGVEVFLFEVFSRNQYTFIGKVELADNPYQAQQPDKNKNLRWAWIFPLKLIGPQSQVSIPIETLQQNEEKKHREARKLPYAELLKRASLSKPVEARQVSSTYYPRDQYVGEFAKRRAQGSCQLCAHPAPFKDKQGNPYLETHHIVWLSQNGEDSMGNTVALCPNCHRKMHILNLQTDIQKLIG